MIDPRKPDYRNTPASAGRPPFTYTAADLSAPPLVSVITPFFTGGPAFHETARSLFRQSLQDFEWLIINDATPHTEARRLLEEYRGHDPRIKVLEHTENKGPSVARNTGVAAARAAYVFLLDDDDLIEPTALEKMYWFLETHPEFAVVNGWEVGFGAQQYLWPHGFEHGAEVLQENFATSRAMVRCAAWQAVGGLDESIRGGMEDWEFWLRLAEHGLWGSTIREYLDWYRRRADHQDRWQDFDSATTHEKFRRWLREKYPGLYSGAFPNIQPRWHMPFEDLREPCRNRNLLLKTKRRLLIMIPHMALGGAERVALEFLRQLVHAGWEVSIVALHPGEHDWAPDFGQHTPDIFILPNFLRPTDVPAFLAHLIASRRFDVVMTSGSELGYLLLPYLRTICPDPAYIDYCHSEAAHWKNGGYARYAAAYQDHLDLTLTTSRYLKEHIVNRGADTARIEVLYVNVDAERWQPSAAIRTQFRSKLGINANQPVVVYAGRLVEEKQPRVLAQVLGRLAERLPDFHALIAGDGPERGRVEQILQDRRLLDRVHLLGSLPSDGVRDAMAASDVFFLPSMWEGIALTMYEAMACGLAVVGADVGGQRELVTPDCGILLPKSDEATEVEAYAEALAGLLTDPVRSREMGRRARTRICESFTLERMATRLLDLLQRAQELRSEGQRPVLPLRSAREWATLAIEFVRVNDLADYKWREANELAQQQRALQAQLDGPPWKLLTRALRLMLAGASRHQRSAR